MSEGEFLFWIALGFAVVCCIGMYLVTRWTKPPRPQWGGKQYWADYDEHARRDIYSDVADAAREKMRKRFEAPRPRLGADEVLRRHLHSTRKEKP